MAFIRAKSHKGNRPTLDLISVLLKTSSFLYNDKIGYVGLCPGGPLLVQVLC